MAARNPVAADNAAPGRWLAIVGIGEDGIDGLTPAARRLVKGAEIVFGGLRHLAIAAPLIANLARHPGAPQKMTLLVQRELAERLLAQPGTSAWGALSAKLLRTYAIRAGRPVPEGLFWPRPRVESRVIHLDLLGPPRPESLRAYDALVEALFQHRRKTLRAALRPLLERGEGGSASDRAAELLEDRAGSRPPAT